MLILSTTQQNLTTIQEHNSIKYIKDEIIIAASKDVTKLRTLLDEIVINSKLANILVYPEEEERLYIQRLTHKYTALRIIIGNNAYHPTLARYTLFYIYLFEKQLTELQEIPINVTQLTHEGTISNQFIDIVTSTDEQLYIAPCTIVEKIALIVEQILNNDKQNNNVH